jgi:hypothetical protein
MLYETFKSPVFCELYTYILRPSPRNTFNIQSYTKFSSHTLLIFLLFKNTVRFTFMGIRTLYAWKYNIKIFFPKLQNYLHRNLCKKWKRTYFFALYNFFSFVEKINPSFNVYGRGRSWFSMCFGLVMGLSVFLTLNALYIALVNDTMLG